VHLPSEHGFFYQVHRSTGWRILKNRQGLLGIPSILGWTLNNHHAYTVCPFRMSSAGQIISKVLKQLHETIRSDLIHVSIHQYVFSMYTVFLCGVNCQPVFNRQLLTLRCRNVAEGLKLCDVIHYDVINAQRI
jgi:hypothetical protein